MEFLDQGQSSLSISEWQEWFDTSVFAVEEFRLVSKLSGAGVVVRVLEAPKTSSTWFGIRKSPTTWMIAQRLDSIEISPYQPIGTVLLDQLDNGTSVSIEWNPHPDVNMLAFAELLGGGLCIISGLIGMISNPIAVWAILLGVVLVFFPKYRAKWSTQLEIERVRKAMQTLPIEWT